MKDKNMLVVQAPGRINIIGEHTDYNDGFVLPAAIDKHLTFTLTTNGHPTAVNIKAIDLNETFSFDLSDFQRISNGWQNYVMGVVAELQQLGGAIRGFDATFSSMVPIGAGMSSSAALEASLATGLNALFQLGLDQWQIIKACQRAEHNYAGIQCGIMDQFASVMGKANHVMRLDCRSLEFEYFPFELGDYELLLLNSKVSHALASSEYNTRRAECEAGVAAIQKKHPAVQSLRDVSPALLTEMQPSLPPPIFQRCSHVVSENQRVIAATQALKSRDFQTLGALLYASHKSLSQDYAVSCPELDFLVDQTKDKDYILGSRMMGGGFGGCTLNLIKKAHTPEFTAWISRAYRNQFGIDIAVYQVAVSDGAGVV
jgi:galactokinase